MNLILLFDSDFISSDRVRLTGRRFEHIQNVLKISVDDELCVGLLNGKIGQGKVVHSSLQEIVLEVRLTFDPPAALPLTLIIPMIRPPMFKRLLFHATTLGIKKIIVLNFNRVEKSFWNSSSLNPEEMRDQMVLGLEQSKDTVLPEVIIQERFKPFVEGELPAMIKGKLNIVAHPEGQVCPKAGMSPVTLLIGPEGGLIPFEIEKLTNIGFHLANLGPRILRVDTALPLVIGKLF